MSHEYEHISDQFDEREIRRCLAVLEGNNRADKEKKRLVWLIPVALAFGVALTLVVWRASWEDRILGGLTVALLVCLMKGLKAK